MEGLFAGKGEEGNNEHTRRAGVKVPSTSKRQMVSLRGRWSTGMKEAIFAVS